MSRTIFAGEENLDQMAHQVAPRGLDYVPQYLDESGFGGLLWIEMRAIIRNAHLSKWQAVYFDWSIRGFSPATIALMFGRDESTVRDSIERAETKCLSVAHRGILTVTIETLGWPIVRENLAEQRAEKMPKIPSGWAFVDGKLTRKVPGK
jgi:hypothetical protein